jgi:diguanylate cyclase (GGDEF)-like protein/hemerythrin-like metal-binding protein/PAS domain S-box-containing protein
LSIRSKIALLVSLLIMALMLVLSLFTERHLESHLKSLLQEQQLNTVSLVAAELGESLRFRQNVLISAAEAFPKDALLQPQQAQRWLNDRIAIKRLFDHFLILDDRGHAIADFPQIAGRTGNDYSQRAWLRDTLEKRSSQFSKPVIGQFVQKPVVIVTAPLRAANGRIVGIVAGIIDLTSSDVLGSLSNSRFGKTGYFHVITPERIIVAAPDAGKILNPAPQAGENPALDRALAGFEGSGEGPGPDGQAMLFGFKRIAPTDWLLVAALPEDEALAPIEQLRYIYWSGALLFMLIAAGLVSMLVGALLRPLSQLRRSMDTLRMGDVSQLPQLPAEGPDELASIARSFNHMADTIRQSTNDLHDSEQKLRDITASLGFGVYVLDSAGCLIFLNPAAEAMLGWNEQEVLGQHAHTLFHHHKIDGAPYLTEECPVHQSIARGTSIHLKQDWLIRRDGSPFSVEIFSTPLFRSGQPAGAVAAFQDVSSRLWAENRIQRQATLDGLTGLVNRRLFMDRLNQALYHAQRNQQKIVLLMLDLDGFKPINDSRGHAGGDQLLRQVARRLSLLVRQSDTVARLGGDEFAVLLLDSDTEAGERVGQKILDAVAQPYKVDAIECRIGVSIGMAVYPLDAEQADTLLIAADTALYASKAAGKHCLRRAQPMAEIAGNNPPRRHRPLIEWTEDYLLGVEIIDAQHFDLTQRINAIEEALINGVSLATIEAQCNGLYHEAKNHFATEESLMQVHGLNHMGAHKVAHHALLAGITAFKNELLGDTPYLALPQMRDWLLEHIQHEDVQLAEMLKNNGYQAASPPAERL